MASSRGEYIVLVLFMCGQGQLGTKYRVALASSSSAYSHLNMRLFWHDRFFR